MTHPSHTGMAHRQWGAGGVNGVTESGRPCTASSESECATAGCALATLRDNGGMPVERDENGIQNLRLKHHV